MLRTWLWCSRRSEDGGGDHGIAEHVAPFAEGLVAGQQDAAALVARGHELEEQGGAELVEREVPELVELCRCRHNSTLGYPSNRTCLSGASATAASASRTCRGSGSRTRARCSRCSSGCSTGLRTDTEHGCSTSSGAKCPTVPVSGIFARVRSSAARSRCGSLRRSASIHA